jgi:hypothetical protein
MMTRWFVRVIDTFSKRQRKQQLAETVVEHAAKFNTDSIIEENNMAFPTSVNNQITDSVTQPAAPVILTVTPATIPLNEPHLKHSFRTASPPAQWLS